MSTIERKPATLPRWTAACLVLLTLISGAPARAANTLTLGITHEGAQGGELTLDNSTIQVLVTSMFQPDPPSPI